MENITTLQGQNYTDTTITLPPPLFTYPAEIVISGLVCLITGAGGIVLNILTAIIIYTNTNLRTPCFVMLAGHAVYACSLACGLVVDGLQRLTLTFGWLASVQCTRLTCYGVYVSKTFGTTAGAILTCMIGVDRLLSLTLPLYYSQKFSNPKMLARPTLIVCSIVGVSLIIASGLSAPGPMLQLIMCNNYFSAFHPQYTQFYTIHNLAYCLLTVGIYGSIILMVKFRQFKSNQKLQQQQQQQPESAYDRALKSQLSVLPLITSVMLAYVIFGVGPEIIGSTFSTLANGRYLPRAVLYSSMLKAGSTVTDFLILTIKCREFRITLKKLVQSVSNKISPISVTGTSFLT